MSLAKKILFLVASLAIAICSTLTFAVAEERVLFTQLIHRHGSRSPLPPVNGSKWCNNKGCGLLNKEGRHMLLKLGEFLRSRYSTLNPTFFPTENYDADTIESRSTDVIRTILSAEAMLRGLYPNVSDPLTFLPHVSVVPYETDILLSSNAVMSYAYRISYLIMSGRLNTVMTPFVATYFGDSETNATAKALLDAFAEETHMQGYCKDMGFGVCLGYVYDIAVSLAAEGKYAVAPMSVRYIPQLTAFTGEMNKIFYGYNLDTDGSDGDTAEDVKARGSCGRPLAKQFIQNAVDYINGRITHTVKHYSAHDTTITPFAVTIGEEGLYTTEYGSVVIIDLIEENNTYYFKGVKGEPDQAPGPHEYTVRPLTLGGITEDNVLYRTTDRVPLADFARFVDSTRPTQKATQKGGVDAQNTYCYRNAALAEFMNCSLQPAKEVTKMCRIFRTHCPLFACPEGSRLVYPTMECVVDPTSPVPNSDDGGKVKIGVLIVSLVATVALGFALGFLVSHLVKRRSSEEKESLIQ